MSASLVGSEMCIRDSLRKEWDRLREIQTRGGSEVREWRDVRAEALRSGCLLYTSDAADDM
eukprot:7262690-Alexandrium_andersonii.AAC.1